MNTIWSFRGLSHLDWRSVRLCLKTDKPTWIAVPACARVYPRVPACTRVCLVQRIPTWVQCVSSRVWPRDHTPNYPDSSPTFCLLPPGGAVSNSRMRTHAAPPGMWTVQAAQVCIDEFGMSSEHFRTAQCKTSILFQINRNTQQFDINSDRMHRI